MPRKSKPWNGSRTDWAHKAAIKSLERIPEEYRVPAVKRAIKSLSRYAEGRRSGPILVKG